MSSRPRSGASPRPSPRRFFDPADVRSQVEALFKWPAPGLAAEDRHDGGDRELDPQRFPLGEDEAPE